MRQFLKLLSQNILVLVGPKVNRILIILWHHSQFILTVSLMHHTLLVPGTTYCWFYQYSPQSKIQRVL